MKIEFPLTLLHLIAQRRPVKIINAGDKPYLQRFYLFSAFGRTFYLHRYLRADADRYMHNHPWDQACSIVLRGYYIERRLRWRVNDLKNLMPQQVIYMQHHARDYIVTKRNRLTKDDWHMIVNIAPGTSSGYTETWTLFFHTEWKHHWGYIDPYRGFVPAVDKVDYDKPDASSNWWKTAPRGIEKMYGN